MRRNRAEMYNTCAEMCRNAQGMRRKCTKYAITSNEYVKIRKKIITCANCPNIYKTPKYARKYIKIRGEMRKTYAKIPNTIRENTQAIRKNTQSNTQKIRKKYA